MKPSHLHTPRNFADATFVVGHDEILHQEFNRSAWWIAGIAAAFMIGFLMGVFGK